MERLSGSSGRDSSANAVSADGTTVVGNRSVSSFQEEPFVWTEAKGMMGLGHAGSFSRAFGVSADGSRVVGAIPSGAFIWEESQGVRLISEVLREQGVNITGWDLFAAFDISADGTVIVGDGVNPDGISEGWVAQIAADRECAAPIGGPRRELIDFPNCDTSSLGILTATWGSFGPREVLEADSGERLWLECGFVPPDDPDGPIPSYLLRYQPPGGVAHIAGWCPFEGGCNVGKFLHSGDAIDNFDDGVKRPDCFISTVWLSKDYGNYNDEVAPFLFPKNPFTKDIDIFENALDWAWSVFDANTNNLSKYDQKYEYSGVTVVPYPFRTVIPTLDCDAPSPEGAPVDGFAVDPPLGPETDAFVQDSLDVLQGLQATEVPPMSMDHAPPCDFNADRHCDDADLDIFRDALGSCFGDVAYRPLADEDGDGCITSVDESILLSSDSDADGFLDFDDRCVRSDMRPTVIIDDCDSKVDNALMEDGCAIADEMAACAREARNHGNFVSCVANEAKSLKRAGIVSATETRALRVCAARSDIR
jgi:hypothetical protein